jgi:hypothetical protein
MSMEIIEHLSPEWHSETLSSNQKTGYGERLWTEMKMKLFGAISEMR